MELLSSKDWIPESTPCSEKTSSFLKRLLLGKAVKGEEVGKRRGKKKRLKLWSQQEDDSINHPLLLLFASSLLFVRAFFTVSLGNKAPGETFLRFLMLLVGIAAAFSSFPLFFAAGHWNQ